MSRGRPTYNPMFSAASPVALGCSDDSRPQAGYSAKWNPTEMDRRQFIQSVMAAYAASLDTRAFAPFVTGPESPLITVRSKDGTRIAVECAGSGPSLVVVHGGTGDHTRWKPLFPLFESRFTICAMDRRGHGASGDAPTTLCREKPKMSRPSSIRDRTRCFCWATPTERFALWKLRSLHIEFPS